jgi:hypothetical protein
MLSHRRRSFQALIIWERPDDGNMSGARPAHLAHHPGYVLAFAIPQPDQLCTMAANFRWYSLLITVAADSTASLIFQSI